MSPEINKAGISRRKVLMGAAAATLAMPFVSRRNSWAASNQLVVRSPGGTVEAIRKTAVWDPFTKETGIEIIPVPATAGKLFSMFKSGNIELDLIDVAGGTLIILQREGALAPIDYASWKKVDPAKIDPAFREEYFSSYSLFASVIGYNKESFAGRDHPKTWAELWDVEKFPGVRSMADIGAGNVNLEEALMADGVAPEDIYPLDLDRAFKALSRIKPHVPKFWDSGALSAQMLTSREADVGAIWHTRLVGALKSGAPVDMEWSQHVLFRQMYGIYKDAKNMEGAQRLVEFSLLPEIQAAVNVQTSSGSVNSEAYKFIPAEAAALMPGAPQQQAKGLVADDFWWADNREEVARRWADWIRT